MNKPTKHDIEILQECAGLREPRPWGAAVGASLEWLRGHRYLDGNTITEKGRGLLEGWEARDAFHGTQERFDKLVKILPDFKRVAREFLSGPAPWQHSFAYELAVALELACEYIEHLEKNR